MSLAVSTHMTGAAVAPHSHHSARLLGQYELLEELGRKHVIAVYKALDVQRGCTVAVKTILDNGLSEEQLQPIREALRREGRIAARLTHPGIVPVHGTAEDSAGNPFIVMTYVEGESLDAALGPKTSGEPVDLAARLEIAVEIADALEYLHSRRVVHRDIKPSNIVLTGTHHPCIVDFGIAMLMDEQDPLDGSLPGTPAFVAPELLHDERPSPRSDIFSFGVLLYWMFTGQIPFSGDTVTEITNNVAHLMQPPLRQHNWALPPDLDRIVAKSLAKDPSKRYLSAGELAGDLAALRTACASAPSDRQVPAPSTVGCERVAEFSRDETCSDPVRACRQALLVAEERLGNNHPRTVDVASRLAVLYHQDRRYTDAEILHCRVLRSRQAEFGPCSEKVATTLNNLALVYRDQGKLTEAQQLLERSLAIVETIFGPEHPKTARRLSNLAEVFYGQHEHDRAEQLYCRLVKIFEGSHDGVASREIACSLKTYSALLRRSKRVENADYIDALIRASAI